MLVSSCMRSYPSERKVFSLVIENEEILMTAVSELLKIKTGDTWAQISTTQKSPITVSYLEDYEGLYIWKSYTYRAFDNSAVEAILKIDGIKSIDVHINRIVFYCGGRGIIPASTNYGFIYSENDDFIGIGTSGVTEKGNGWLWQQDNGDNRFYIENIIDDFYYYEDRN